MYHHHLTTLWAWFFPLTYQLGCMKRYSMYVRVTGSSHLWNANWRQCQNSSQGWTSKKKIRNRWNFWSSPDEAMELQTTTDLSSRGCVVSQSKVNRCTLSTRTKMFLPFPFPFPPLPVTLASISMQFSVFGTSPFLPHSPNQLRLSLTKSSPWDMAFPGPSL